MTTKKMDILFKTIVSFIPLPLFLFTFGTKAIIQPDKNSNPIPFLNFLNEQRVSIPDKATIFSHIPSLLPLEIFLCGALIFLTIYHMVLYIYRRADRSNLYFSITSFFIAIRLAVEGGKILYQIFPDMSYQLAYKFSFLSMYIIAPLYLLYLRNYFKDYLPKNVMNGFIMTGFLFSLITLMTNKNFFYNLRGIYAVYLIFASIIIYYTFIRAIKERKKNAVFLMTGFSLFLITVANDILQNLFINNAFNIAPYGYFLLMLFSAVAAAKNIAEAYAQSEKMKKELEQSNTLLTELNHNQESIIKKRTRQIAAQKEEIEQNLLSLQAVQQQLIEAEKMKSLGELVAGVAHEINTPIGICVTSISSMEKNTEEMKERFNRKEARKEDLEEYLSGVAELNSIVLKNLKRTAELIRSFKMVSIDRTAHQKRHFVLKTYLEDILLSLKPELKKKDVAIMLNCPEEIRITSYPGDFSQIITNLVVNSLVHGIDKEGSIEINVTSDQKILEITYKDTGKGIAPENIKKIFDPFFTTGRGRGCSGLGLHIVYNTVTQSLGGKIECSSIPGKETRFLIRIPLTN